MRSIRTVVASMGTTLIVYHILSVIVMPFLEIDIITVAKKTQLVKNNPRRKKKSERLMTNQNRRMFQAT